MAAVPPAPEPESPFTAIAQRLHAIANALLEAQILTAGNEITLEAINNLILASEARIRADLADIRELGAVIRAEIQGIRVDIQDIQAYILADQQGVQADT